MFNFLAIVLMLFLSIVVSKIVLTTLYYSYLFMQQYMEESMYGRSKERKEGRTA